MFINSEVARELKIKIGEVLKSFPDEQIDTKEKIHLFKMFLIDIDFNTETKDN